MENDLVTCPTCGWSVFKGAWICKCTIGAKDAPAPNLNTAEPVLTHTHKHDIWKTSSGDFRCRNCDSNGYSLFVERGCPGAQQVARPATPELPEWASPPLFKIDPAVMAEAAKQTYTFGRSMIFVGPNEPQTIKWSELCDPTSWVCTAGASDYDTAHPEDPALSRALSTPLPHDPDIHTRVMPWRGKADE